MNITPPIVSICIPAYNAERFIAATLESALAQDYPHLEIIVSDDCSTDRTLEIIYSYEKHGVRVLRQEKNLGMTANMNAVIRASSGKYICKLDADDLLEPAYVSQMVGVMEAHPRITFSHCACRLIDVDDNFIGYERSIHGSFIRDGLEDFPRWVIYHRAVNIVMLRRSAFDAVGGYDETFGTQGSEDWKICRELLKVGDVFYNDQILARYRVHQVGKQGLSLTRAKAYLIHLEDMEKNWPVGVPNKNRLLEHARRLKAMYVARSAAFSEGPEREELIRCLPLYGNYLGPRLLVALILAGGGQLVRNFLRCKLKLRQIVKMFLYHKNITAK